MKKNDSYFRIMEYITNNIEQDLEDKRILLEYATLIMKKDIENIEEERIVDILYSLKKLLVTLENSVDTSLTRKRIEEVYMISEELNNCFMYLNKLNEISYRIDKLYLKLDLPPRTNSSLSFYLYNKKKNNR